MLSVVSMNAKTPLLAKQVQLIPNMEAPEPLALCSLPPLWKRKPGNLRHQANAGH